MDKFLLDHHSLLEGHFLLSSGKHSNRYVQCARLTEDPKVGEAAAKKIAEKVGEVEFDTVVGPAMGGILIGYELARVMNKRFLFTEREEGKMTLRRGFEVHSGEKILICEDVVTTGISSMETAEALEEHGAQVVGIASIIDRTVSPIELPLYSAFQVDVDVYDPESCPLCEVEVPLVKPGSRGLKK